MGGTGVSPVSFQFKPYQFPNLASQRPRRRAADNARPLKPTDSNPWASMNRECIRAVGSAGLWPAPRGLL